MTGDVLIHYNASMIGEVSYDMVGDVPHDMTVGVASYVLTMHRW